MPKKLSHYDGAGRARMVDVSGKPATRREAEASAFVAIEPRGAGSAAQQPQRRSAGSGPHRRHHGRQTHRRTDPHVPPLPLSLIDVDLRLCENGVAITSKVATTAETGVEMEALVAVSVAALTVYDMCKAADKGIEIREIALERKTGGKSGDYRRAK